MKEELVDHFNENGFVIAQNLLDFSEIKHYKNVLKEAVSFRKQQDLRELSEKTSYEQSFIQCQNLWEDFIELRRLAFDQRITGMASKLLGVDKLRIWHDQALIKEGGGRETDIHHDQPYWPIKETSTVTAWIPMVKISDKNGQMGFFPGSHKIKEKKFTNIFKGKVEDEELNDITQIKGVEPQYIDLEPGDVSFHHGLTFHNAKPNKSLEDRPVYTVIYFADGSTRENEKFHFSVDRASIKVGEIIDSDVTPIAYPIDDLPERPKNKISDEFMIQKMLGLLPAD
ncbi:MAG: hypothetical protein CMD85_05625 [Gammaproteobacteria bacterium]|nr:hypothetical protein [Gammaproteobacteria bacterium]|tara:strand:- start:3936 stop:4787 length:852 start_codon:yes stop_codon:yes gene_type:complete